jgi:DNA-binding MarR family transcriptional regulator
VIEHFDGVTAALGKPVSRRLPLCYMRILLTIVQQKPGDQLTATQLTRELPAFYDDVAAVVRTMRKAKWIELRTNPDDRRSKFLELTAKGQELAAKLARLTPVPQQPQEP